MQKKYVSVNAEVDTDGVIRPLLIRWHDGRQWEVTKVLHTCTASHDEFEGVRYTVKIGRAVKYLYREGRRWYVDRSPYQSVVDTDNDCPDFATAKTFRCL